MRRIPLAQVTLAVPCRTDEPELGRTLAAAWASWTAAPQSDDADLEVLVCLNGADSDEAPALRDVRAFAAAHGAVAVQQDLDAGGAVPPPASGRLDVRVLRTRRAGKPIAWNVLRHAARAPVALFLDADVAFAPDTFGLLLDALEATPDAVLASPKTTCAARPTAFERIMAAPYRVDFPNLSGQLYAARVRELPAVMPDDLIEPERWLELVVGKELVVRNPEARVVVRLPATLRDFFRQRIRIEMGKVQLAHDYPGLERRGQPQPRGRVARANLSTPDLARLAVYVGLREIAYVIAWWRFRNGGVEGVWRQAASTKHWDDA